MGKKGKKKEDPAKKAALQAKKEAKAEKAAQKRLNKEARKDSSAEEGRRGSSSKDFDLDSILEQYRHRDNVQQAQVTPLESFPAARANASLTLTTDKKQKNASVYLFGGEYYDGIENIVVDQLFVADVVSWKWKQIQTPTPTPPARCAHSTVYYNQSLYVFGGEMATADQYHHYKDVWKFHIPSQSWKLIPPSKFGTHPTARSGHSAVVWKHFMIVFGGFFEALRDAPRWFNDVTVLNLQTEEWMDIPHSRLTQRPEPRSACNVVVLNDKVLVQGGFSKLAAGAETKVHTDAWLLHLLPLQQNKPPTWERLFSTKTKRSGTTAVPYRDKMMVVYGGVVDTEKLNHKVESIFYNDMFALDMGRRKWFPLVVRKPKGNAATTAADALPVDDSGGNNEFNEDVDVDDDDDDDDDVEIDEDAQVDENQGWNLDKLRSSMFAFIDGDGNLVYEKIEDSDDEDEIPQQPPLGEKEKESGEEKDEEKEEEEKDEEKEEEKDEEKEEEKDEEKESKASRSIEANKAQIITSSSVMTVNPDTQVPEAVTRTEPLPRIKANVFVAGHSLYVYGGLLEVGDREVTLDDLWRLDLRKRNGWECLFNGTMHQQVWRGAVHDDEDSYVSASGTGDLENDDDEDNEGSTTKSAQDLSLRQEIANLNAEYNLSDENQTPQPLEALAAFYARTAEYWNQEAAKAGDGELTAKELKRQGFALAKERFDELEPIMERLRELDLSSPAKSEKKLDKGEKTKKSKKESKKESRKESKSSSKKQRQRER